MLIVHCYKKNHELTTGDGIFENKKEQEKLKHLPKLLKISENWLLSWSGGIHSVDNAYNLYRFFFVA